MRIERLVWLALSRVCIKTRPRHLVTRFLAAVRGADPRAALQAAVSNPAAALAEAKRDAALLPPGVAILACTDPDWPPLLREIPDPPPVLFIQGRLETRDDPAVAVVGARQATTYGLAVARWLGEDLAFGGVTVVSGLARGIDSAAHEGALRAAGGRTLAVLAHGPDRIYPPENVALARAVARNGALLTEFPPGTAPRPGFFTRRNRLISGLSRGVVVVEAARRSGSLATARLAGEQNREVFAVPGPVTAPTSAGSNQLLADGAHPARTALDVVAQLPLEARQAVARAVARRRRQGLPPGLTEGQKEVWKTLDPVHPVTIDRLAETTGRRVPDLLATLLELEIRGLLKTLPGGAYLHRDWTEGG